WRLSLQGDQQRKAIRTPRPLHRYLDLLQRPVGVRGQPSESDQKSCFGVGKQAKRCAEVLLQNLELSHRLFLGEVRKAFIDWRMIHLVLVHNFTATKAPGDVDASDCCEGH